MVLSSAPGFVLFLSEALSAPGFVLFLNCVLVVAPGFVLFLSEALFKAPGFVLFVNGVPFTSRLLFYLFYLNGLFSPRHIL